MKKSVLPLIVLCLLGLLSCGGDQTAQNTTNVTHEAETPQDDTPAMHLNNGERWEANKETTDGVQNMIALMEGFKGKESVDAYHKLSEGLGDEFQMIFKNCTMKGEAHDQLHLFLIPMKDYFKSLSGDDLAQCKASFQELRGHLDSYAVYFQ